MRGGGRKGSVPLVVKLREEDQDKGGKERGGG